jgi:hypothetical protein
MCKVPVHVLKEWGRGWCQSRAPLFLNLGTRWDIVFSFTPCGVFLGDGNPVATEYEVRWTTELTWTFCRRGQFLSPAGRRNTIRPVM